MKKVVLALAIVGFGFMMSGCGKKKTADELLKEVTAKEAKLIKKSVSEKASKAENAINKELDTLKKIS